MAAQNNMMFTTQDQDHDAHGDNCAVTFRGPGDMLIVTLAI